MTEFESGHEMIQKAHEIADKLHELQKETKAVYENSESEYLREIAKFLNMAYSNAATKLLNTTMIVLGQEMKAISKIIRDTEE